MDRLNATNSLFEDVISAELNSLEHEAYERCVVQYLNSIDDQNRTDQHNLKSYSQKLEQIKSE